MGLRWDSFARSPTPRTGDAGIPMVVCCALFETHRFVDETTGGTFLSPLELRIVIGGRSCRRHGIPIVRLR